MSSISEDEFRGLPEAPLARFLALETLARDKLLNAIKGETDEMIVSIAKQSYISTVLVAAKTLNIPALKGIESKSSSLGSGFDSIFKKVVEATTELRLTAHEFLNLYSVKLSRTTREMIADQITLIRERIPELNLPDGKQKRLLRLLKLLEEELDRPRSSLSRVMVILGFIGAGTATAVEVLADIPTAIGTITTLIGQQKDEEPKRIEDMSEEIKLLPPPMTSDED